jgi:hypothetical protein
MSSLNKLFQTLLGGRSDRNLRFADLRRILLSLNFSERITGGHHIFTRQDIVEIINLPVARRWKSQAVPGQAGA